MTRRNIEGSFHLSGGDFTNAGAASSELKSILTNLGINPEIVRRAAIATFEAEMNVIIHAVAGVMYYLITQDTIKVVLNDMGPGIPDIDRAMTEGYSTAPDWIREMGWGAGMGLPNMKKNSDRFKLDSVVGEGTTVEIIIRIKEGKTE
ncbi:MAG: ATP-binding protein [Nitrospirae bacterium]|nr:ATP-binding protein [Nitrospirota bacterium]